MKRFLVLYSGPPAPPNPSHEGWPQWFSKIGDALVDLGSPTANGFVLHTDGSTREDATGLNGYSVVQARDRREVLDLLSDQPYLALGGELSAGHRPRVVCRRACSCGRTGGCVRELDGH